MVVCVYVRVWLFEVLGNADWAFTGKLCIAILSLESSPARTCDATRPLMACKHILASLRSQQGTNGNMIFEMSFQYTERKLQAV